MIKVYTKEDYAKAYSELIEIFKNIPEEDLNKIPKEQIEIYKNNKDNSYIYEYNANEPLEQQISHLTQILIANIYIDYWADNEEKENIKIEEKKYFLEQEKNKQEIYKTDIFSNKKESEPLKENTDLVVIEKKGLLKIILTKIKEILKLT